MRFGAVTSITNYVRECLDDTE